MGENFTHFLRSHLLYVVGDIHGEIEKLDRLIGCIVNADPLAGFIFVGDYIDKGKSSKDVLSFLTELKSKRNCTFLMGNHEYHWLNLLQDPAEHTVFLQRYGAEDTVKAFQADSFIDARDKILDLFGDFFCQLVLVWENEEFVVTHSGVRPDSFEKATKELNERDVLFNRYSFLKTQKLFLNRKVIFGHTSFFHIFYDGWKIGIDTGACYFKNQPLTAINISNSHVYNSDGDITLLSNCNQFSPNIIRHKAYERLSLRTGVSP